MITMTLKDSGKGYLYEHPTVTLRSVADAVEYLRERGITERRCGHTGLHRWREPIPDYPGHFHITRWCNVKAPCEVLREVERCMSLEAA